MQRKGYLIRFIDIGLIILFGFLMISDLTVISQIALPGKNDAAEARPDSSTVLVGVVVQAGGRFSVQMLDDRETLYSDIEQPDELELALKTIKERHAAAGRTLSVYIEPAASAPMQRLVDVLDVCERLDLPRNINTEAVLAAMTP